jgi:hypothetical protein
MTMRNMAHAVAAMIQAAIERMRVRPDQVAGQLSGSQVAPAASGSPGVVDRDDLLDLSDATPEALGVAGPGSSSTAARGDHIHAMPSAADVGAEPALGDPASDGYLLASTVAGVRSWVEVAGTLSDDTPEALGVAGPGSSSESSRADHVHAMPSAADVGAPVLVGTPTAGNIAAWDSATAIEDGGVALSSLARTDIAETFDDAVTILGAFTVGTAGDGGTDYIHAQSLQIYHNAADFVQLTIRNSTNMYSLTTLVDGRLGIYDNTDTTWVFLTETNGDTRWYGDLTSADLVHAEGQLLSGTKDTTYTGGLFNRLIAHDAGSDITVGTTSWGQAGYIASNMYLAINSDWTNYANWRASRSAGTNNTGGAAIILGGNNRQGVEILAYSSVSTTKDAAPASLASIARFDDDVGILRTTYLWLEKVTGGLTGTGDLDIAGRFNADGGIITDSWSGVGYQNSWANYGSGWPNAEYYIDPFDIVHLQGLVKNPTAGGTTIFTLPSGYRPATSIMFTVATNSGFGRIDIDTSGNVKHINGGYAYVSLNGITFRAA